MKPIEALFASIPPRENGLVNVIIDTPRGSGAKLRFDRSHGCFRLAHLLPAGHVFPFDFGSVPGTLADDGDELDAIVLMDAPTCTGCLVAVRVIGALAAAETKKGKRMREERLVAVPVTGVNRPAVRSLSEIEAPRVDELEHFFHSYNLAHGRRYRSLRRLGARKAEDILDAAIRKHDRKAR